MLITITIKDFGAMVLTPSDATHFESCIALMEKMTVSRIFDKNQKSFQMRRILLLS